MKLLKQPNDSCLLYAAAMVLDEPPEKLIREIGHDGQDIWWPELTKSFQKRSFNIQEIIDCFIRRGYGLMPIHLYPCNVPPVGMVQPKIIWDAKKCDARFLNQIDEMLAIITGQRETSSIPHAVAWDGYRIYDPMGEIYTINNFMVKEAWIKVKLI